MTAAHGSRPNFLAADPALYVLARPSLDAAELSAFLQAEASQWRRSAGATPAEDLIELAGRICYMSFGPLQSPRGNAEYIRRLIEQEHESVLEHASWTFLLTGVSRAFSHQMVRHRVGFSFSQLSQQYHDEAGTEFVMPQEIKASAEARRLWLQLMEQLRDGYESISRELSRNGARGKESLRAVRSAARSVLPNATQTKLVFSANGRALRHFLATRGAIVGDLEMRKVSALILTRLKSEAPALVSDFELLTPEDGQPLVKQTSLPPPA
jgi:thymidylate synthase (FAD)